MKAIAVIDLGVAGLYIYDVPENWIMEEIEDFIMSKNHRLNDCSWGEFDGEIIDTRNE